jgi:hypothetical protein
MRITPIVPRRSAGAAILLVGLAALGGCAGTYDANYVFGPRPAEVALAGGDGAAVTGGVRVLMTVVGVRRRSTEIEHPASIEVRVRVENDSDEVAWFDPASLRLLAADLEPLPPAVTIPEIAVDVAPGAAALVDAFFPFPGGAYPGGYDLSGLNARLVIEHAGRSIAGTATFVRRFVVYRYGYGPYWGWHDDWHTHVGFGVGWCD